MLHAWQPSRSWPPGAALAAAALAAATGEGRRRETGTRQPESMPE